MFSVEIRVGEVGSHKSCACIYYWEISNKGFRNKLPGHGTKVRKAWFLSAVKNIIELSNNGVNFNLSIRRIPHVCIVDGGDYVYMYQHEPLGGLSPDVV